MDWYSRNGFVKFGAATLGLIFAPFVLSFFLDFAFTTLNALSKGTFQFRKFKKRLFKAFQTLATKSMTPDKHCQSHFESFQRTQVLQI